MLKFILIVFLISYVIYKVGGFLFRMLFISAAQQHAQRNTQQQQPRKAKAAGGNVNIDYVPDGGKKKSDGIKGGEYVDFEDIKD